MKEEGNKDRIVAAFDARKIAVSTSFPVICVYDGPTDYPGRYIARLWDMGRPTHIIAQADTLEELRLAKPEGMIAMPRSAGDDPIIVETWI